MLKNSIIFFLSLLFLIGCGSTKNYNQAVNTSLPLDSIKFWYHKDYALNKIPGISLEKWYSKNTLKLPKNKSIIVAVLDTQIDKNHEDLRGQLWVNEGERPNNHIDDDNNGYVDDVEGWSFTGTQDGGYVVWSNHEYTRLIRLNKEEFDNKKENEIVPERRLLFKEYIRAKKVQTEKRDYYENWHNSLLFMKNVYPISKDSLKIYFKNEDYTIDKLDSLYKLKKINDKTFWERKRDNDRDIGALIEYMISALELKQNYAILVDQEMRVDSILNKSINTDYYDRIKIGDDEKILQKGYGNNNISNYTSSYRKIMHHSTRIAGIIAGNRNNETGVLGFSNQIKIMPLNISPMGDKHDKDIATAIYYAVDNGAKIINMSFSKEFSVNKEWVFEALKYAESKNVLVVNSAGNNGYDIDKVQKYPNDISYEDGDNEICKNYINVGATTNKATEKLVANYSNYGKNNVDIFAPGTAIYLTGAVNSYETESGTSYSTPMVSGTAALIWLYYPNLSAQEVKQIIVESGTSYDIEVVVPGGEGKKVLFKELSKSGKVLNVYNAMNMAEEVSKKKK